MPKTKKKYVLVRAAKYNNSTDVLFMFEADDFRLQEGSPFSDNYTIIGEGAYDRAAKTLTVPATGETYMVFRDWSLRELNDAISKGMSA